MNYYCFYGYNNKNKKLQKVAEGTEHTDTFTAKG